MLLDAHTAAGAKKTIELGPQDGKPGGGREPQPSWSLPWTDVEPAEHDNAGLRVQLPEMLQRHGHLGTLGDREELVIGGQFRHRADVIAELRRQGRRGFVGTAGPPEDATPGTLGIYARLGRCDLGVP